METKYQGKELKLINKVHSLFQDNLRCIEAWGFYIFSDELEREQELKNKLSIIWLASLFDTVVAQSRLIKKYEQEANELGLIHIPRYLAQANVFCDAVKALLQQYSKEEQIFIQNIRNQWVHSHLNGVHSESIKVKYLENGEIVSKNLPYEKYHDLIRPVFYQGKLDDTLASLRQRFMNQNGAYWYLLKEIQVSIKIIYGAMLNGSEFQWQRISI
ncbi:hypothetical protein [Photobacterium leiognathi]|uniref:HEPN AbiU2-like domain-containing protein n=1 Tax=Photobacterium leiognathi TaxID=553611 RepID=A0ABX5GF20_PHOLE|nr:hypothetical protein [Photobacterium leiognathi]KJF90410.1 hypothetical protein UB42_08415 [Photobacterium leiognathi]PSV81443.1 hypothetical protein CTM94_11850 [Photobacterium leiognathi]